MTELDEKQVYKLAAIASLAGLLFIGTVVILIVMMFA